MKIKKNSKFKKYHGVGLRTNSKILKLISGKLKFHYTSQNFAKTYFIRFTNRNFLMKKNQNLISDLTVLPLKSLKTPSQIF